MVLSGMKTSGVSKKMFKMSESDFLKTKNWPLLETHFGLPYYLIILE